MNFILLVQRVLQLFEREPRRFRNVEDHGFLALQQATGVGNLVGMLFGNDDSSMTIGVDQITACSASHFTIEDLFRAHHTHELEPRPEVILNLDGAHRGLGTGSCGPDTLPRYRIRAGLHRFAYRIRAVR